VELEKREFDVTLGIRTIREFEPILREQYEDIVTSCQLCKYIMIHVRMSVQGGIVFLYVYFFRLFIFYGFWNVLQGYQCPKCKINIHKACFSKYTSTVKTCLSCRALWKEKDMVRRVRDSADDENTSPVASTSAAASSSRKNASQRQAAPVDDTLEDMPVLETMVSSTPVPKRAKTTTKAQSESPEKKKGRGRRK
jgi:hypothetical protein